MRLCKFCFERACAVRHFSHGWAPSCEYIYDECYFTDWFLDMIINSKWNIITDQFVCVYEIQLIVIQLL